MRWEGPYRIIEQKGNLNFKLANISTGKTYVTPAYRIKLFPAPKDDPSQDQPIGLIVNRPIDSNKSFIENSPVAGIEPSDHVEPVVSNEAAVEEQGHLEQEIQSQIADNLIPKERRSKSEERPLQQSQRQLR